jgi:hypothetical protein
LEFASSALPSLDYARCEKEERAPQRRCFLRVLNLSAGREVTALTSHSAEGYDFCFPKGRRSIYVFSTFVVR